MEQKDSAHNTGPGLFNPWLRPDHEICLIIQLVLCVLSDMWLHIWFTFIHFLRRGSFIDIISYFTLLHTVLPVSRSLEDFKMWVTVS